ncbi:MAG TPA: hypothetical protein VMP01_21180 [Pirellulaceae bacterium]|nr:hypothetical protein [Pirellulaceae bacterium]
MSGERIPDDEIVYRRIPPTMPFFESPDRVTTQNFKLDQRQQELGLSVYRAAVVTAAIVLAKGNAVPGSRIVQARVGEIRVLAGGDGKPLHLDVIVVADEHDPGHAEIRGPEQGKLTPSASKALQRLFTLL